MSLDLSTSTKDTKEVYRLVRLDNAQVIAKWNEIENFVISSFYHIHESWGEEEKTNIFKAIASEKLQCWGIFKDDIVVVFGTTAIVIEFWGERSLLICSLYGFDNITIPMWHKFIKELSKYAKEESCKSIKAVTENERILQIVKLYGGSFKVLLSMEV